MAINVVSTATSIAQTGWADRRPEHFMDEMVKSSKFLSRMTVIDGIKTTAMIPTYDAELFYGTNLCDLTDGTGGNIELGEKIVEVKPHTWFYSNCKTALEGTYRSMMLRKGTLNPETLDADLKDWALTHFAKLNAARLMVMAEEQIFTKLKADKDVVKVTSAKTSVIEILDDMYKAIPADVLNILYGEADRDLKPVILMNAEMIRDYSMEVAKKDVISYNGIAKGEIPNYMGMEIVCFNTMKTGDIVIMQPSNLLLLTDDFGDTSAIQAEYIPKKNTDEWYGQYKIGFDYRYSKYIIARLGAAATFAEEAPSRTRAAR